MIITMRLNIRVLAALDATSGIWPNNLQQKTIRLLGGLRTEDILVRNVVVRKSPTLAWLRLGARRKNP